MSDVSKVSVFYYGDKVYYKEVFQELQELERHKGTIAS